MPTRGVQVNRKNAYLFLCVLGAVLPYSEFIPWIMQNGPNAQLFVRQLFANRIGGFFGWDVLISGAVLVGFVHSEGKRLRIRQLWLPIAGLCAVGVSFGFPLFLYLRERALEGAEGATGTAATVKSLRNSALTRSAGAKKAPQPGRSALIFRILFGEVLLPFFRSLFFVLLRLLLHSNLLLRLSRCRASPPITRRSFHIRAVFVGVKRFRRPRRKSPLPRRGSRIVALARQDGQTLALHPDLNGVILRAAVRPRRRVRQGVLVAGFFRDPRVKLLHRPALQSVINIPSGIVGVFRKPFESPVEKGATHAHTVDRDVVSKEFVQRLGGLALEVRQTP